MRLKQIFLIVVVLLFGCSEELKVTPFTYPQIFTGEVSKAWTLRTVQLLEDGKGTQTFGLNTCVTDDIYTFYNNPERTFIITEGSTKCADEDPDTVAEDTWSFVNATATLTMVMPLLSNEPLPFVLKEVDNTKLVIDIYFNENKSSYRFNFRPRAGG